jgi:hypothetical protein
LQFVNFDAVGSDEKDSLREKNILTEITAGTRKISQDSL